MTVIFKMGTMNNNTKKVEIEPLDRHWVRITIKDSENEMSAEIRTEDFTEAYDGCRKYISQKSEAIKERTEKSKARLLEIEAQNDERRSRKKDALAENRMA